MFPAWKLPAYEVVVLHSGFVCFIAAQFYILLCLCRESVTRFSVMWLANKKYCKNSLSLDINSHKTMKSGAWGKLTWYLGISHGRGGGGVLWSWLGIPVPLLPLCTVIWGRCIWWTARRLVDPLWDITKTHHPPRELARSLGCCHGGRRFSILLLLPSVRRDAKQKWFSVCS